MKHETLKMILKRLLSHLQQQNIGLKLSITPYSPKRLGNIQTLYPAMTQIKYITSRSTIRPTKKINKQRDINHIPYFNRQGQTGNSTNARTLPNKPSIIHFLETVVSKLNEQNLAQDQRVGSNCFGYFKFFISSGLLKQRKLFLISVRRFAISQFFSIIQHFESLNF